MTEWHYDKLEEAGTLFLALAARSFNGQQQTPVEHNAWEEDEESDVGAFVDDDDDLCLEDREQVHCKVSPLVSLNLTRLKEKFLDNFAELLARKKDSTYVSCAALVENGESATIFVSRNEKFRETDDKFFKSLSAWVAEAGNECGKRKASKLLDLLLDYYKPRLRYHIKELVANFPKSGSPVMDFHWKQNPLLKDCKSLAKSCRNVLQKNLTVERGRELSAWACQLSRAPRLKTELKTVCTQEEMERMIRRLRFIARIRAIHGIFQECMKTLPWFCRLTITPVPTPDDQASTQVKVSQAKVAAVEFLQQWSVPVPNWFKDSKLMQQVSEDYGRKLTTHAEIQMAFFFAATKPKLFPFPYLGISKKTCYMCDVFLCQLKRFKTRPSHAQLHPRWTLPRSLDLGKENTFAFGMALSAVKQSLAEILRQPTGCFLPFRPESTTVWSSRPSIRSASSVAGVHIPASRMDFVQASYQGTALTCEWNAASLRLLKFSKPTDNDEDVESTSSDVIETDQRPTLEERFNTLVSLLMTHFDELPDAIRKGLADLDFDPVRKYASSVEL